MAAKLGEARQDVVLETGSFFYSTGVQREAIVGSEANSRQRAIIAINPLVKQRKTPIISQKLMRMLERSGEEDSFTLRQDILVQKIPSKFRFSSKDKSTSLDESKFNMNQNHEFSFGKFEEAGDKANHLLEAHEVNKRSKLAKLTYRINAAYKNRSMEEGLPGVLAKVPRSAGSRIDILSQPGRINGKIAKVQFTIDSMNTFKNACKWDKRYLGTNKPSVASEETGSLQEKPGTSGNTPKGQHLNLAPFYINSRGKFSTDFSSSKRLFHLSNDLPNEGLPKAYRASSNEKIANMTKKYLQRISTNASLMHHKRMTAESNNGPSEYSDSKKASDQSGFRIPSTNMRDPIAPVRPKALEGFAINQSYSMQIIKKRPRRAQLAKAMSKHPG
jgi:hypothetical protein